MYGLTKIKEDQLNGWLRSSQDEVNILLEIIRAEKKRAITIAMNADTPDKMIGAAQGGYAMLKTLERLIKSAISSAS